MAFVIQIIQFLAGLSIIVGIHELGHLFFAKLFKMRVNSYMIGFPPKIFKIKWGETEYAIGSIPLGGAVQIAGMIDESLDDTHLANPPQPWEFRSKAAWQRLIVILGGIIFNLISGMLIYIGLTYGIGHTYLPKDVVNKYGVMPNTIGRQMGFQAGDKIIKINGKDFEAFEDICALILDTKGYYTIQRAGSTLNIPLSEAIIAPILEQAAIGFLRPIVPCILGAVTPNSNLSRADLVAGDQIIELAGQPIYDQEEWLQATDAYLDKTVEIVYRRHNTKITTILAMDAPSKQVGIFAPLPLICRKKSYSLLQSIPIGLKQTVTTIQAQLVGIRQLLTGKLSIKKSLAGPISIAKMFGPTFIWSAFLMLVASLSIVIGLTNALPLPVLDGGHALFILYEMLFRRKVSDKFVQIAQQLGMILLCLIMLYVCGNDIRKLFA